MTDQEAKSGPNQPNLNWQLEMVGFTDKDHQALSQGSWASLIGLTTYFHGLAQSDHKVSNLRPS